MDKKELLHPHRFLYAAVGAMLFVVLGWGIPEIYFKYFDHTAYVFVKQPVQTDKHIYRPGDEVVATIVRTSYIVSDGNVVVQLALVKEDGGITRRTVKEGHIVITPSDQQVYYQPYVLPTDLKKGKYHLEAIISYYYRNLEKHYGWQSVAFTVDPDLEIDVR